MNNRDRPAFQDSYENKENGEVEAHNGLTKREYFAAMAMQGLCASQGWSSIEGTITQSIRIADELLKQLES